MARRKKSLPDYVDIGLSDEQVDVIVDETIEAALSGKGTWHPAPTRGRPSLNGKPEPSPHVGFRVSPELRDRATELARQRGVSLSHLAREALEHYVRRA